MKRVKQSLISGETSEEDIGYSYLGTLMYGRYQRDLSESAREEARRLKRLKKKRLKEDRLRKKELVASYQPRGKVVKSLVFIWKNTIARLGEDWVFLALLGIINALMSFTVDQVVKLSNSSRMWMYANIAEGIPAQYFAWVSLPFCLILFAAGFVHIVAPQSIGSGIPELKTILRGVHLKEYLTFKTLVAKVIGLTATLGCGLPLGKEGPFVHIASIVASLLSKLMTRIDALYSNESRTPDLLAAACAVGVAACFAAPIGGVLFSIEVTTTYFAIRNYWRGFFAAICGATMFRLLSVWTGAATIVKPLYPTNLPEEFPFDPQELIAFALMGSLCGVIGALAIFLHRKYVIFMRNSKRLNSFLQKNLFIYPGFVVLLISSTTFPPGLGRYVAGGLNHEQQVLSLFSNFTWSSELNAEQAAVVDRWRTPDVGIVGILVIYIIHTFFTMLLATTIPVPTGNFLPSIKMGAALGRLTGEILHGIFPNGISYGGAVHHIVPGGYAKVGAAAMTGAVTHTVSTVIIFCEMTGQITHVIPLIIAVLAANAVAASLQPSTFDSFILIKKLPYLPDLLSSASRMYDICVEDFMIRDVKFIWNRMTFQKLKDILKQEKNITSFPLVDSPHSMVLLGSIHRWELIKLIERHIGRKRRQQVATKRLIEAETLRLLQDQGIARRPSRFEVSPAPDILASQYFRHGQSLPMKNQFGLITNPGLLHRPKSILKNANSVPLSKDDYSASPLVHPTVHGTDTRIRAAFEAIFKGSSQPQEPLLADFRNGDKRVTMSPESIVDMSGEEQRKWETEEMAREVDFNIMLQRARSHNLEEYGEEMLDENLYMCHIDPAPFQLVERTSLLKVHSLFSTLGVSRAYVTAIGKLIGVVTLVELRKAIEDVNSGDLKPRTRLPISRILAPSLIPVVLSEPAPPTDDDTALLTVSHTG